MSSYDDECEPCKYRSYYEVSMRENQLIGEFVEFLQQRVVSQSVHDTKVKADAIDELLFRIANRKLFLEDWQWKEITLIANQIKENKND